MRNPNVGNQASDGAAVTWLVRLERRLLAVFGPADLGRVGRQPVRSPDPTAGVVGGWDVRRDSTGRTYLVSGAPSRGLR